MIMRNYIFMPLACFFLTVAGIYAGQYMERNQKEKPTIQAPKFRFGEQCPDGLRVEYINTLRLPKSVVCQKEVGEE